ncbi:MAG: restriction endonuclease subunit S [Nanoarchaeota archaeon]|nr:restriction endonuclease subunit S [Nanoarchaeota archaeon]
MNTSNNWIKFRFDEIVQNITDRVPIPSESGLEYYIGLEHLDTDQIRIKRFGSTKDVNATKFLCKKGDIIFGKRNAYLRKVAITDRDAVVSAHSMVFRPTEKIDEKFLHCFLQSSTFWKIAHAVSEGSMSPTIKWKILAKQEFLLPNLDEQKKIADLLWSIEDNIEKNENLIKINEKLKKGLLDELLIKGIGHTKLKKTKIGEIPEDWDLVTFESLSKVFTKQTGFDYSKTIKPSLSKGFKENHIPFIQNKDFEDKEINFNTDYYIPEEVAKNFKKILLDEKCLLISISGRIGNIGLFSNERLAFIGGAIAIVKFKDETYLEWCMRFFKSKPGQDQLFLNVKASSHQNLILSDLRKLLIPIPKEKEMNDILFKINEVDNLLNKMIQNKDSLYQLKKKMTDEIFKREVKLK